MQWLAGFKLIGVTTESRNFGDDLQFHYRVPVVDVYLNYRSSDPWEAAAAAPPWSTLPWELIVLMEEAVKRGIAAFSESEAKRRGIPWLDLVRDHATGLNFCRPGRRIRPPRLSAGRAHRAGQHRCGEGALERVAGVLRA